MQTIIKSKCKRKKEVKRNVRVAGIDMVVRRVSFKHETKKEVRRMGWFIAGFLSTTAILEG